VKCVRQGRCALDSPSRARIDRSSSKGMSSIRPRFFSPSEKAGPETIRLRWDSLDEGPAAFAALCRRWGSRRRCCPQQDSPALSGGLLPGVKLCVSVSNTGFGRQGWRAQIRQAQAMPLQLFDRLEIAGCTCVFASASHQACRHLQPAPSQPNGGKPCSAEAIPQSHALAVRGDSAAGAGQALATQTLQLIL